MAQTDKPCTYSIRSDANYDPVSLVGPEPSGDIIGHSRRTSSGFCTYLVGSSGMNAQTLKLYAPSGETKELGILSRDKNSRMVTFTPSGAAPISGALAVPISKGVMILRDNAAFLYEDGKAIRSVPIPPGWSPAAIQQGDVLGAQAMLLVSNKPDEGLFNVMGAKGATLTNMPPDVSLRYGILDLASNSIVTTFQTYGVSKNEYLVGAAKPKDDDPYAPNNSTELQFNRGYYLSSPADWFTDGASRYVVHYGEKLTEIWLRDLNTGKAKKVAKNILGFTGFYALKTKGIWQIVVNRSVVVPDIASMSWD